MEEITLVAKPKYSAYYRGEYICDVEQKGEPWNELTEFVDIGNGIEKLVLNMSTDMSILEGFFSGRSNNYKVILLSPGFKSIIEDIDEKNKVYQE